MTVGIFDSGLGGLTVLRALRELVPAADTIYYADQANVPYGDRGDADLRFLLARNIARLEALGAEAIVVGCTTTCAIAHRYGWPAAKVPVLDLIDAAAAALAAASPRRIGVVATAATVRSGAYGRAIRTVVPGASVVEIAAPRLVPLVESGASDGSAARDAVAAACAALGDVECVVLGCTHFPFLEPHFRAVLGPRVTLLDPARVQAERARDLLAGRPAIGLGRTRYVTTGRAATLRAGIERLLGPLHEMEEVEEDHDGGEAERRTGDHLQDRVRL